MRNIPTFLLKIALSVLIIPIIIYAVFLIRIGIPDIINGFKIGHEMTIYAAIILGIVTITGIPYSMTIYQAWRLLNLIDANEAFSLRSVVTLRKIKYLAVIVGCMFVVALPFTYIIAQSAGSPGLLLFALILGFVSLVIAVFANILQKLLYEALLIKEENDLTVWGESYGDYY